MIPCVIFEDEHLLVVNKPAGMNTHAPSPFAGEGIYDWLRHREPRWARLAIIHRLDKETSGLIVFGKTGLANRSLTEQFTKRAVHKMYLLLTDREVPQKEFTVKTSLVRLGDKYVAQPLHAGGEVAETRFVVAVGADARRLCPEVRSPKSEIRNESEPPYVGCYKLVEAEPLTGRTHQIRVHAADSGFPILGDALYGGTRASRVCLHSAEISFRHPADGKGMIFRAPPDFDMEPRQVLRRALIDPQETNAFRLVHGSSDDWPGWYVDQFGDFLLSQSEASLCAAQQKELVRLMKALPARGVYHKTLTRQVRRTTPAQASPQLVAGEAAPERFMIRENGVQFEMSFAEGYSAGLFLDQRDNRRRFLTGHVASDFPLFKSEIRNPKSEILNAFAYTCGFSLCAALAGATTTSLDLSKKNLDWGKRNFALNGLEPARHDFIYGDVFDWLRRLAKKRRTFDVVVLDPPTFSQSKEHGVFRVEKDFGKLVAAALPLIKAGGVLFASTNAADWPPEDVLESVKEPTRAARRNILRQHYVPQPPDFPISRAAPAYLKTVWLRLE
jgi:23S rRNA (cytosine1962-C5)-methyltransferase